MKRISASSSVGNCYKWSGFWPTLYIVRRKLAFVSDAPLQQFDVIARCTWCAGTSGNDAVIVFAALSSWRQSPAADRGPTGRSAASHRSSGQSVQYWRGGAAGVESNRSGFVRVPHQPSQWTALISIDRTRHASVAITTGTSSSSSCGGGGNSSRDDGDVWSLRSQRHYLHHCSHASSVIDISESSYCLQWSRTVQNSRSMVLMLLMRVTITMMVVNVVVVDDEAVEAWGWIWIYAFHITVSVILMLMTLVVCKLRLPEPWQISEASCHKWLSWS